MHDGPEATTAEAQERPWRGNLLREHISWQREFLNLVTDPVWLGRGIGKANGSPVMLIPGFLSGDSSLSVMHRWMTRIGLRSHRAGIVWNADCAARAVSRLEQRLSGIATRSGRKVDIVAHSRGGLFARALASRRSEHIGRVITLGSPLADEFDCSRSVAAAVTGARIAQNLIRPTSRHTGCFTAHCLCGYSSDLRSALPDSVRLTSIYTTDDGIVRPAACRPDDATWIAVGGSHLGLVVNARVYGHLARLLCGPEVGDQRP